MNFKIGNMTSEVDPRESADYLLCDGRLVAQADYPELFAALGHEWAGEEVFDQTTLFRLPDLASNMDGGDPEYYHVRWRVSPFAYVITGSQEIGGMSFGEAVGKGWLHWWRDGQKAFIDRMNKSVATLWSILVSHRHPLEPHSHPELAAKDHNHPDLAPESHTHDDRYAQKSHTHAAHEVGAATADHDHDGRYATIDHAHAGMPVGGAYPMEVGYTENINAMSDPTVKHALYLQAGGVVFVSAIVDVSAAAAGRVRIGLSLPEGAPASSANFIRGVATTDGNIGWGMGINNNEWLFAFDAANRDHHLWFVQFSYPLA
ncbi:phage tail protein [Endothiovibrio diazotrophicus]